MVSNMKTMSEILVFKNSECIGSYENTSVIAKTFGVQAYDVLRVLAGKLGRVKDMTFQYKEEAIIEYKPRKIVKAVRATPVAVYPVGNLKKPLRVYRKITDAAKDLRSEGINISDEALSMHVRGKAYKSGVAGKVYKAVR